MYMVVATMDVGDLTQGECGAQDEYEVQPEIRDTL